MFAEIPFVSFLLEKTQTLAQLIVQHAEMVFVVLKTSLIALQTARANVETILQGENGFNCPYDCHVCGNKICELPWACGNRLCEPFTYNENRFNCPSDCDRCGNLL